jgi:hypothetical protein
LFSPRLAAVVDGCHDDVVVAHPSGRFVRLDRRFVAGAARLVERGVSRGERRRYGESMKAIVAFACLVACSHPPGASTAAAAPPTAAAAAPAPDGGPPPVQPTPGLAAGMARLAFMRGVWAGPATGTARDGSRYTVTQTERMGPMLGGDVVVIEGRGYHPDGSTGFNAFGVVSYDPRADKYELRSYAQGQAGTFELRPTPTGYVWEIPAGPDAIVRFTATIQGDRWREVGEFVAAGRPPVPTFEMNLRRVGDTDWPLGTPISPVVAK